MLTLKSSLQNCASSESISVPLLPITHKDTGDPTITCYDNLGKAKTHGKEPRYVSSTTGVCRKLVIQSVNPTAPNEKRIRDHAGKTSKLAVWLVSTNPFHRRVFVTWTGAWLLFTLKLLWDLILPVALLSFQLFFYVNLDDWWEDSELCDTGDYKPYVRKFRNQFWAARSKKEYSTHVGRKNKQGDIPTHSLYPRLLMIRDAHRNEWSICTDPSIIKRSKYMAISYAAADVYAPGPNEKRDKELFIQEVRLATVQKNFDAYWLDLECIGETQKEKNLGLYCMADVYRGAELTLIMLANSQDGEQVAWGHWGGRVWTLPEALLSQRLFYKFRGQSDIQSISLHQLANLAYSNRDHMEQAIINSYSGRDPLERLERLSLLKSAIWRRGIRVASTPTSISPYVHNLTIDKTNPSSGAHAAERVYALMGFFEHRIEPDYAEDELQALVRLSMANDSDRIAERMVSLLSSTIPETACWYANDDIYDANLWDVIPEIQVAGVTEHGALVLDGCRAACIRWKGFPEVSHGMSNSMGRKLIGFLPYLAWPVIIAGIVGTTLGTTLGTIFMKTGGIVLLVVGLLLLLVSPRLFVIGEGGQVIDAQPWLIGVKGVLDINAAAMHLYGGGNIGPYPRLGFTPSGSEFAVPDEGSHRGGSKEQYIHAKGAEDGLYAGRMYTLIDTYSSTIYYFSAGRPPTVCLFTGREGGLGRFVLCSERCGSDELHKESVVRMPTYVSGRMDMCGWLALG